MTDMPAESAVAWVPEDLPIPADSLDAWAYIVLEEIVDDVALLRRWPWPVVDQLGRLLWPGETEHEVDTAAVDLELLKAQLYTPNRIRREPRCGDTFAASRGGGEHWPDALIEDLRDLLGSGGVYDISADAREAAKIAYHSSLGAIAPAATVADDARDETEQELQHRSEQHLEALRLDPPPHAVPVTSQ
jgi:hypothetical protein